jgi:hypothetical protein
MFIMNPSFVDLMKHFGGHRHFLKYKKKGNGQTSSIFFSRLMTCPQTPSKTQKCVLEWNNGKKKVGAHFSSRNTFVVGRHAKALGWD